MTGKLSGMPTQPKLTEKAARTIKGTVIENALSVACSAALVRGDPRKARQICLAL